MSKSKTYWQTLEGRKIEHLWRTHPFAPDYRHTACGLMYGINVDVGGKGDRRCKNCLRVISA